MWETTVMHEPAGVIEILVQILQNTLFWNTVSEYPPENEKLSEILALWLFSFRNTPPSKIEICADLGTLTFSFRIPPRKWKLSEILALWLFSFRIPPQKWKLSEILAPWLFSFRIPPKKMKICADLGTLTFQFQNTPPKWKLSEILALWLFSFRYPPKSWNLCRSWHFAFSVSEYPPPPKIEIWADLGTLRLSVSELCVASYHMWRLYPARITTRFSCWSSHDILYKI